MHRVSASDGLNTGFRKPEVSDLPLADEIRHRADGVFNRYGLVYAVLVVEVDIVGVESAKGSFDCLTDVFRAAVDAGDLAVVEPEAKLGCDDEAFARDADLLHGAGEELLVHERPINFRRVEKRASELDGATDGGDGFAVIALFRSAVRLAHPHQTESDGGDGEPLSSEFACGQHKVCLRVVVA